MPSGSTSSSAPVSVRSTFVLFLDAGLLLLFILVLSPNLTGLPLHEWFGLAFIPPITVHLLFARSWITRTLKTFFITTRWRTRVNFVLNALLFVLIVVELFSGVEISQVALPPFGFPGIDDRAWRALHNDVSRWVELIICMHIAMNWSWIEGVLIRVSDAAGLNTKKTLVAPNRLAAAAWILFVLLGSAVVAVVTYRQLGGPTLLRLYHQDEIAHYTSSIGAGAFEFLGETLFIVLFTVIGRVCLRLRL